MPKAKTTTAPAKKQEQTTQSQTPQEQTRQSTFRYDINIYPSKGDGAQKAGVTVNLNDAFAIRGIRIMQGTNGLFVSMPSYKVGSDYKDYCFPCTKESKAEFDKAILNAYQQKMEQLQTDTPQQEAPQQEQGQQMAGM